MRKIVCVLGVLLVGALVWQVSRPRQNKSQSVGDTVARSGETAKPFVVPVPPERTERTEPQVAPSDSGPTPEQASNEYRRSQELRQQRRDEDKQAGRHQDIAEREARLKESAKLLAVGMAREEVVQIMGPPAQTAVWVEREQTIEGDPFAGGRPYKQRHIQDQLIAFKALTNYPGHTFDLRYTPFENDHWSTKALLPREFKTYDRLLLRFDTNGQLAKVHWGS